MLAREGANRAPLILCVAAVMLTALMACGTATTPDATTPPTTAPVTGAAAATAVPASTAPPQDVVSPGKVTVMVGGFGNERFLPRYCSGECHTFGRLVHGYFATTTHQGGVIPSAMESWRLSDGGRVWTFKLREGARFHNGDLVTAEDVLFSSVRSVSEDGFPESATPTQTVEGRQIEKQEITGPGELTITFKNPYAGAAVWRSDGHAGNIRMSILPAKLLQEPYDQTEPAYEQAPIGAGPFRLTAREPAQSMKFERFDDYYYQQKYGAPEDRRPRFQSLDLLLVPELSTRVSALRAGQSDLIEAAEAVKDQLAGAGGRFIYAKESSYVSMMLLGCWKPEVRCYDKRVRLALDHAVDRQTIVESLYTPDSYALAGWNFVTPNSLGYSPELSPTEFDPDKARELLKEAGYRVPGSSEGKEFGTININAWNAGDVPFIPDMAQLIAESWQQELGIDAKVIITDRTLITQLWRDRQLDDHVRLEVNEARWDGSTIAQSRWNDFENSQRLAEDPELAAAAREAFNVVDPGQRHAALNKLYLRLKEEQHALPMGHANLPWGASKRIAAWEPWPAAAFFNAHWTIRLAE